LKRLIKCPLLTSGGDMTFEGKHSELTGEILGAFYNVYNRMGYGFSEKVYGNALAIELRKYGFKVDQQKQICVYYDNLPVGEYFADVLVNGVVILELKAVRELLPEHEAQLLNYLKASLVEVGLLLNFGPKVQHIREIYDNDLKGSLTWIQSKN
jgi:GxxExxY protein